MRESSQTKIYGVSILSSLDESKISINDKHQPFDVQSILKTPYIKDQLQEQYFCYR